MKLEKRGKYAGVKVHLDPDEVRAFVDQDEAVARRLGKKLRSLLLADASILAERSEEEISIALHAEAIAITEKIAARRSGGEWQTIHKTRIAALLTGA